MTNHIQSNDFTWSDFLVSRDNRVPDKISLIVHSKVTNLLFIPDEWVFSPYPVNLSFLHGPGEF